MGVSLDAVGWIDVPGRAGRQRGEPRLARETIRTCRHLEQARRVPREGWGR